VTVMNRRILKTSWVAASVLALAWPALSAEPARPMLTGMWDYVGRVGVNAQMATPPGTPAIMAMNAKRRAAADKGVVRNVANLLCLPTGFPQMMNWKSPIEILESPGRVTVLSEHDPGNDEPRTIYLDRKAMPENTAPSWNGYSVGRWEGKTLVVRTENFNDRATLFEAMPRTPNTKITERLTLAEGGKVLLDEMTIVDPAILTKPWIVTLRYARMPAGTERLEAVCEPDLEALRTTDLKAIKDIDPEAARLLDPNNGYNPGGK
jgi:hypothetical protein